MLHLVRRAYAPLCLTLLALVTLVVLTSPGRADGPFTFASIDGGALRLEDWRGRPVLVVNTASRCGYTPQYTELQKLQDRYADQGLVVLAVPSNDFRQELATDKDVAEFCEVNFDLTLPMTTITHVRGDKAHPFYAWLRDSIGFEPRWNFNKVLIGPDGTVMGTWESRVKPLSSKITRPIEAALTKG